MLSGKQPETPPGELPVQGGLPRGAGTVLCRAEVTYEACTKNLLFFYIIYRQYLHLISLGINRSVNTDSFFFFH